MMFLYLLLLYLFSVQQIAAGDTISMPGCVDHCGNVKIPYPFGVGFGCYHDEFYEIICNPSFTPPKPVLRKFNLEVLDINWLGRYSRVDPRSELSEETGQILTVSMPRRNLCKSVGAKPLASSIDLKGSPYRFSRLYNVLMVEGCGDRVVLMNKTGGIMGGCASVCTNVASNMNISNCYGVGCCQAFLSSPQDMLSDLVNGFESYQIDTYAGRSAGPGACNTSAALVQIDSVKKVAGKLINSENFPTVLQWRATYITSDHSFDNSVCFDDWPYDYNVECRCKRGFEGNPYLPHGCQVDKECGQCGKDCSLNSTNFPRYYRCRDHWRLEDYVTVGTFGITIFLIFRALMLPVVSGYLLYIVMKRRRKSHKKAEHFKRNGGLLLQQQMSSGVEKTRIFTVTELMNATDNFSKNRLLGQGGQGTVYKGILPDGQVVAIKKSTRVDESRVEQFVNEVVILSEVNHRNVVRILGCCLDTEVPILVYEFISNGTLYQHIHGQDEDFNINWKMRLRIAAESADALAYLHSSSSTPIYHRDIKSTNILLDEKYRAKISDFGISRVITIEQTHVTTVVQGTYGYMDPEYFQSNQFTEKSDVYSFGVVLVELITGKKPISPTGSGRWLSLATEFQSQMEDSRLLDIVDSQISDEGTEDEFLAVAELAIQCLDMNGKWRPTMKEVAILLDGIRSPHLPNAMESTPVEGNHIATEISQVHSSFGEDPPAQSIEAE